MVSVKQIPYGADEEAEGSLGWFAVKTHAKHEHVAAAHLRQDPNIQVYLPRLRFKRRTQFGAAWVTEALFQTYLFARFDLQAQLRRVQHTRAVRGVVHFGTRWPVIPDLMIEELRRTMGDEETREISDEPQAGETVCIAAGPLSGLHAVVSRVMTGPRRVEVLLEFLGRQSAVELSRDDIVREDNQLFRACLV